MNVRTARIALVIMGVTFALIEGAGHLFPNLGTGHYTYPFFDPISPSCLTICLPSNGRRNESMAARNPKRLTLPASSNVLIKLQASSADYAASDAAVLQPSRVTVSR